MNNFVLFYIYKTDSALPDLIFEKITKDTTVLCASVLQRITLKLEDMRVVPKVTSNFFFARELGTANEGECGGRWNQLLCYP